MSPEIKRALRLGLCDIPKEERNGIWKWFVYGMMVTAGAMGAGGLVTYLVLMFG